MANQEKVVLDKDVQAPFFSWQHSTLVSYRQVISIFLIGICLISTTEKSSLLSMNISVFALLLLESTSNMLQSDSLRPK